LIIETLRFGALDVNEKEIINFKEGLPGLENLHRFIMIDDEDSEPIKWMQSIDDGNIVLPMINPFVVLDDYEIDVNDHEVEYLGLWEMKDLYVLCVVLIPEKIEEMTVNLAAPVLINISTGDAKQVLVDRKDHAIKHPIFEAVYDYIEGSRKNVSALAQN